MKYQHDYSLHFPATKDAEIRERKATKIVQALMLHLNSDNLSGLTCLDLGCSIGIISRSMASAGAHIIGVDIDLDALRLANKPRSKNPNFVLSDAGATPFDDETFDILICSQVYEHTPSLTLLVDEIQRVLKTGGMCFFSGPNRWAVMEEHYHLPFLSWLPKAWADRYLRWSGRAIEYYECPRSAGELREALADFEIDDLTPELLLQPERFAMKPEVGGFKICRAMGAGMVVETIRTDRAKFQLDTYEEKIVSKNRFLRIGASVAGYIMMITTVYLLFFQLREQWPLIASDLSRMRILPAGGALISTLILLLLMSTGWSFALRAVGVPITLLSGFAIYYQVDIFHYLPGGLWHLPGRAYLCQQRGIPI